VSQAGLRARMGHCFPKTAPSDLPQGYQPPAKGPVFADAPEPGHEYEPPKPKMRLNALGMLEPVPELPHFSKGEPALYPTSNAGPFIQLPRSESSSTAASGMHAYTNIAVPQYNKASEKDVGTTASETHAYANIVVPQYNQASEKDVGTTASETHAYGNIVVPQYKQASEKLVGTTASETHAYTNIVVQHYNQVPDQYGRGGDELTTHSRSGVTNQHQGSQSAPTGHSTRTLTVDELRMREARHGHSDAGKLPLPDFGTSLDEQQYADGIQGRQDAMQAALHEETQHALQQKQSWTNDPFSEWRDRS